MIPVFKSFYKMLKYLIILNKSIVGNVLLIITQ